MQLPRTPRGRVAAVAVSAVAIASIAGGAVAATSSLPTNPPSDASLAKMTYINKSLVPQPKTFKGFDGFLTYTVKAPAGKSVLQGFATLSGGQTGSVIITSTQATATQYTVKLKFPGQQGTPGKLSVRVQLLPKS